VTQSLSLSRDGASAISKVAWRLVVPLAVLLFLNSVDRVNISFAALHMNAALGLTPKTYGLGVSLFFVGYLALQIPNLWLLRRFGMRRWLFCIALIWGCAATAMAFIDSAPTFYLLRIVLGAAEGGFAPGLVYYLTHWMPQRYRARAISKVMVAVPVSIMIGGPVSGWLMSVANPLQLDGWRWMLLAEGAPTVLLAVAVLWLFADRPEQAAWLTHGERYWLAAELTAERRTEADRVPARQLLTSGRVWGAAACWFALMSGAYGLLYWLPQLIKQLSNTSDLMVGVLSSLPWAAAGIGMLANSWHSDRSQERYWHVALAAMASGAFMALAAAIDNHALALGMLILSGLFFGAAQSPFWTIPPTFLSSAASATGIALINLCGNAAGLIGPPLIGLIRERSGSFDAPVAAMSVLLVAGGLTLLAIRPRITQDRAG
jgi:MFS transporter, ACS family, tartrate transporter